jgi:hypothetical protein
MRPAFLTVLCILTFLWSSIKIYSSISNYQNAETMTQTMGPIMEEVQEKMAKDFTPEQEAEMDKSIAAMQESFTTSNIKTASILSIISGILLILAGVWMWDLKKKGFWTYIAGNALGIIAPIFVFGGAIGSSIAVACAILAAIFIGLYAINLKSLA